MTLLIRFIILEISLKIKKYVFHIKCGNFDINGLFSEFFMYKKSIEEKNKILFCLVQLLYSGYKFINKSVFIHTHFSSSPQILLFKNC